jgi:hypothetical protein
MAAFTGTSIPKGTTVRFAAAGRTTRTGEIVAVGLNGWYVVDVFGQSITFHHSELTPVCERCGEPLDELDPIYAREFATCGCRAGNDVIDY